jgi:hypothetical protein
VFCFYVFALDEGDLKQENLQDCSGESTTADTGIFSIHSTQLDIKG